MNQVCLVGRLCRDVESRYSAGENATCVSRYTLAVDRQYKRANEEQTADFINCVAFGKAGEFAEKYLHKGMKIAITGRIQTGSYENKEGSKVYTTDIIVATQEFCEKKSDGDSAGTPQPSKKVIKTTDDDGFMNIPDNIDEELPFN